MGCCQFSKQVELGYLWAVGRIAVFFAAFFAVLVGVVFFPVVSSFGLATAVREVDFASFFVPGFDLRPSR